MKIRSPFLTRIISLFLVYFLRSVYATCRIVLYEQEPGSSPYTSAVPALKYDASRIDPSTRQPYLYCMWHDMLLMSTFCGKTDNMAALVSRHQDGSYLAYVLEKLKIKPIRGSSRSGGSQAARQCLEAASEHHLSITPDGPIGPRHELKPGIVFLASQSGRQIVPVTSCCKRFWRIEVKWTDMLIPKPFTTIYMITGKRFDIPKDLSRDQIDQHAAELEKYMHEFTQQYESLPNDPELIDQLSPLKQNKEKQAA